MENIKLTNLNDNKDRTDVNWKDLKNLSDNGLLLGELSHGGNQYPPKQVSFSNVSHVINNIRIENNTVYGDIKIINTPNERLLKNLIKSDIKLDISERSMGSIDSNGKVKIDKIIGYDFIPHVETKIESRRRKIDKILIRLNKKNNI